MGDLPIKPLTYLEAARLITPFDSISLKRDGTLMEWKDGQLISPRGIVRNDRFPHIVKLLKDSGFPNCLGEMYIENGKVHDVTSKIHWPYAKFMPFTLTGTIPEKPGNTKKILGILSLWVGKVNSPYITPLIQFKTVEEGWEYCLKHQEEGLVLQNDYEWYKVKVLKESKVKIIGWEEGKQKGAFLLEGNNKVSGTKIEFVQAFARWVKMGKEVKAEIEYPFITKEGHYFQPRLRRVFVEE